MLWWAVRGKEWVGVLRLGGVCGAFGPKAVGRGHTLGNLGLGLGRNSFMAIVKKGNTNGSAVLGTITKA